MAISHNLVGCNTTDPRPSAFRPSASLLSAYGHLTEAPQATKVSLEFLEAKAKTTEVPFLSQCIDKRRLSWGQKQAAGWSGHILEPSFSNLNNIHSRKGRREHNRELLYSGEILDYTINCCHLL